MSWSAPPAADVVVPPLGVGAGGDVFRGAGSPVDDAVFETVADGCGGGRGGGGGGGTGCP